MPAGILVAYPADLLARSRAPHHRGRLAHPTHSAQVSNPLCGDEIVLDVRVADGYVAGVGFAATGCAITIGAADLVAEAVQGSAPADVAALDDGWLHDLIGMVPPPGRRRCASLALEALQGALAAGPHGSSKQQ